MGSFKKFEFDNFIIAEDEEPEIEAAVAIYESAEDEFVSFEPEPLVVAEPEVKTYSAEELEKAQRIAEQTGYEKGYKAKDCEVEQEVSRSLESINIKLLDIITSREQQQIELEKSFMQLNLEVINKLIPGLNQEMAVEILNRFLADNFPNFKNEAKLSFYLHPEVVGKVQEQIAHLAHIHDFEGKISLHKGENLGIADCKVEWENGGVERNSHKILEKIDNLLEEDGTKN